MTAYKKLRIAACALALGASGVLAAMGVDAARARGAVRLSVGINATEAEIGRVARALIESWQRLCI
jgi:cysteine sulfinate desulfinase/cysteine desulfurase-like protein